MDMRCCAVNGAGAWRKKLAITDRFIARTAKMMRRSKSLSRMSVRLIEPMKLNREEKLIKIAEFCGFRNVSADEFSDEYFGDSDLGREVVPNYLDDLNAMRHAVMALTDKQKRNYAVILRTQLWPEITWPEMCPWDDWRGILAISEATAEQRANALLLTIA